MALGFVWTLAFASLILAGVVLAQPGLESCGPDEKYPAGQKVCIRDASGYHVCPASDPCACPAVGYGCYNKAKFHCNKDKFLTDQIDKYIDDAGECGVSTKGDPLVQGFDGCSWYMKGQPGSVVNLVTETNHVVNSQLVPANLTDEHHTNDGTFHGAISMRYKNVVVTAAVDAEGNLTVSLDNNQVPFEATRQQDGLLLKVSQHLPEYGQVAEVSTPAFRFFLHAVQPYNTSAGWSRGHLDLSATIMSGVSAHGLLGQTVPRAGSACPDHFDFAGEGTEEDYIVSDLQAVNFEYNLFSAKAASRRLHMSEAGYQPLVPTLTAVSSGFH